MGVNLEVLILCHRVRVLYIHGCVLTSFSIISASFHVFSPCRNTERGRLRRPEQIPVPRGHHPLARHYQEPPGRAAGGTVQQQQPWM